MLALAPLILWEFWQRTESQPLYAVIGKLILWAFAAAVITAPWLLSNIPGNLRAIGTVQFSTPMGGATPWRVTMRDFLIGQGAPAPDAPPARGLSPVAQFDALVDRRRHYFFPPSHDSEIDRLRPSPQRLRHDRPDRRRRSCRRIAQPNLPLLRKHDRNHRADLPFGSMRLD